MAVNAGGKPSNADRFANKRAEMWGEMKYWLEDDQPVQILDTDALHADLTSPKYAYDSNNRLKVGAKGRYENAWFAQSR